ncbi:MAG TPA: phage major capsid protein [Reyranella sp.]|nr:phage major capsid protein [Reyranella sp.]
MKRQYRNVVVARGAVDTDKRTVSVSFSSEEPVERFFGDEILGHQPGEVDLSFIGSGNAPVLVNHDPDRQVGVVQSATVANDRGQAVLRFGQGDAASEVFQDIVDGIRSNVSVGYEYDEMVLVADDDGDRSYRITNWRPLEISIVAIPADPTVGANRAGEQERAVRVVEPQKEQRAMPEVVQTPQTVPPTVPPTVATPPVNLDEVRNQARQQALDSERERVKQISELGARHNRSDLAQKAIAEGKSFADFQGLMLEAVGTAKPLNAIPSEVGMSAQERKRFSLCRAVIGAADRAAGRKPAIDDAFEMEVSDTIAKRLGKAPRSIYLPMDPFLEGVIPAGQEQAVRMALMGQRTNLNVATGNAGGYFVATELLAGSFIDLLRNRIMVATMGATFLPGLVANITIPKQSGAATANWLGEGSAATESQLTAALVSLSPKTVHAMTDYSRETLLQSTPAIEALVRSDLIAVIARAIDLAALSGSGSSGQPTGLANQSGLTVEAVGTNGGTPSWTNIVNMETDVAAANADFGSLGYLTNAKVRGKLKQTAKIGSTYPVFIWENNPGYGPGFGEMNGMRAGVSNQCRSNLTKGSSSGVCSEIFYGNWADLLIGEWGVLDMLVDNITQAANRIIRMHAYETVDVNVRHIESFSYCADATTT